MTAHTPRLDTAEHCRTLATSLTDEPEVDLFDIETTEGRSYLGRFQASCHQLAFESYVFKEYGSGNCPYPVVVTNIHTDQSREF